MTNTATKRYQVTVIERALAFYEVEAEDARTAAANWHDGEFHGRDDEAVESDGLYSVREQQPDRSWQRIPKSEWEAALKPYSVLLHYPDYLDDTGYETFYAFVTAADSMEAVAVAQRQAAAAQSIEIDDPDDFQPLLVVEGHHNGQPLFNK